MKTNIILCFFLYTNIHVPMIKTLLYITRGCNSHRLICSSRSLFFKSLRSFRIFQLKCTKRMILIGKKTILTLYLCFCGFFCFTFDQNTYTRLIEITQNSSVYIQYLACTSVVDLKAFIHSLWYDCQSSFDLLFEMCTIMYLVHLLRCKYIYSLVMEVYESWNVFTWLVAFSYIALWVQKCPVSKKEIAWDKTLLNLECDALLFIKASKI